VIALLLAAAARAEEPATFDRLFGPQGQGAEVTEAGFSGGLTGWAFPLAFGAVGLVLALKLKKGGFGSPTDGMRVLMRQHLGDRASVALVEVDDGQGGKRRLLLGVGAGGVPSLVADLGRSQDIPTTFVLPDEIPPPARIELGASPAPLPEPPVEEEAEEDEVEAFFARSTSPRGRFFSEDDLAPVKATPARIQVPAAQAPPVVAACVELPPVPKSPGLPAFVRGAATIAPAPAADGAVLLRMARAARPVTVKEGAPERLIRAANLVQDEVARRASAHQTEPVAAVVVGQMTAEPAPTVVVPPVGAPVPTAPAVERPRVPAIEVPAFSAVAAPRPVARPDTPLQRLARAAAVDADRRPVARPAPAPRPAFAVSAGEVADRRRSLPGVDAAIARFETTLGARR
jgi:flagellar biogenesis protein FliO